MARLYANQAYSTLASVITNVATTLTVATGEGARFPSPTGGDTFDVTLENAALSYEVVSCTARSGDVLTIVRAQQGTAAAAWAAGDRVELRLTRDALNNFADDTVPIWLTTQTTDMTATAGIVKLQARTKANASRLEIMTPNGLLTALQVSLYSNRVTVWKPGSGTTMNYIGLTGTVSATASHPTPTTATLADVMYRTRFACSTTAGNSAGIRDAVNTMWMGNSAGRGGFRNVFMFCSGSINLSTGQQIVGLTSQTTTLATEPSAVVDVLAMVKDSADTNWFFARRTASGTVVKTDLGVAAAVNQTFEVEINAAANSSTVYVRIIQWAYDGTYTTLLDTSYTTSIPASTTLLGFMCHTRNNATASANNIDLVSRYTFSDF